MNRTPEEKEADRKAVEARYEALEKEILAKIEVRQKMVRYLVLNIEALPEKSRKFVRDLEYMGSTYDSYGRHGGRLSDLSDKQLSYLNSLDKEFGPKNGVTMPVVDGGLVDGGQYSGTIVAIKNGEVVQRTGRDPDVVVRHDLSKLSRMPVLDSVETICYVSGAGVVADREQKMER